MQQTTYKTYQVDSNGKKYQNQDTELISGYDINSLFVPEKHHIELHVYSIDGELLQSNHNFIDQAYLQGAETAGTKGASRLTLNPEKDAINLGYEYGGIRMSYNFTDNLFSELKSNIDFFIEEISPNRTEVRLLTTKLTDEQLISSVQEIREKLQSSSYFSDFRLNFKKDTLLIGTNINVQSYKDGTSVIVKLYEPLPQEFTLKNTLTLEELVSDKVTFEIEAETSTDEVQVPFLKGPNFSLDLAEETTIPSQYLNYEELFSFPTNNTYRELRSLFEEKSISISIDYTDYENFIQFSSADERLRNFKYKLDLVELYQTKIDDIEASPNNLAGISGSRDYYQGLINNILENFDHYDRHLYYDSGSSSWPKIDNLKPYTNATGSATGSWWDTQIGTAVLFDQQNPNQLLNTVPAYLREDPNNEPYNVFLNMLGQHFDNLWIYSKAVTDKYDADNRLDKGISKDLIQDALKNFGLKLYTSNKSTEDLFKTFTGEFLQPEEEFAEVVKASTNPTSEENYRREVYKRLYHNLPLLLKSKGTERAVRVLLNSFGIPTNFGTDGERSTVATAVSSLLITSSLGEYGSYSGSYAYTGSLHKGLYVKTQGGHRTDGLINLGPQQNNNKSLSNIKIDKTGSLVSGSTLSIDTSINKRPTEFTDQIHSVEIGYSVAEYQNDQIYTALTASGFNIDDIIGDPGLSFSSSYDALNSQATSILKGNTYNLQEFTRLLKFYDNVVFKMVKDFVPARSNTATGIVVKPHLLERNKIKQVSTNGKQYYTNSTLHKTFYFSGSNEVTASHNLNTKDLRIEARNEFKELVPILTTEYLNYNKVRVVVSGSTSGSLDFSQEGKYFDGNILLTASIDVGTYNGSHGSSYGLNTSNTTAVKVGSLEEMISSSTETGQVLINTASNQSYIRNGGTSNTLEDFSLVKTPTDTEHTTNYVSSYMTSGGLAYKNDHLLEQAKYNGELSGSQITVSQTDFYPINPFKYAYSTGVKYKIDIVEFEEAPTPTPTPTSTIIPTPTPTSTPIIPTPTITSAAAPTATPTPTVTSSSPAHCYDIILELPGTHTLDKNRYGIRYFDENGTLTQRTFNELGFSEVTGDFETWNVCAQTVSSDVWDSLGNVLVPQFNDDLTVQNTLNTCTSNIDCIPI